MPIGSIHAPVSDGAPLRAARPAHRLDKCPARSASIAEQIKATGSATLSSREDAKAITAAAERFNVGAGASGDRPRVLVRAVFAVVLVSAGKCSAESVSPRGSC